GEEELDAPNIVSDENEVSADDVGESVETDDLFDSFIEENPDEDEEPDDAALLAADKHGFDDFGIDEEF
ncbi:MAG: hypothetical protein II979_02600, partial [Clostridia bacterium]|nr:hypothetical protein [Clostridia bacterium]